MVANHIPVKSGKVLDMMGSMQESMTPSARRISEFVMDNPAGVTKLSIAELSQTVNVGEATIIRFCRMLGFKGFQDFKMDLAIELSNQSQGDKSILDTDITAGDGAELIGQKLQATINNVLSETLNLLSFEALEAVAQQFRDARAVYFFGVGSSGITAEDAKNKFMRIGYNVDALTNNHFMYMKASLLQPGDLAIGISHSGNSLETTKALMLAKEAGASTVALTHNPKSGICKHADWVLLNGNRQGQLQGDSIGTKITQLFVLDLVYTLLVKDDVDGAQSKKLRTTKALES
ncbi:MurR/RpiR family transcriptional regulator [Photobacterium rosenbergii]|uniref:MurR/RpiR family transcriptional regulator n=1 Tax=Photobacterium rosenbergii TaxID=294936 RepID=UPI001C9926C8|nr:MurR/RpiR family transcriptional regulator [Photobacterium rosenbergii]MBY5943696.1 MurR/RpiR family transcriptional regulator [Photobacterium rosenbergii]